MSRSGLAVWLFWTSVAVVAYTYVLYPLLLALWARLRGQSSAVHPGDFRGSFSVVMCAHNEGIRIASRVTELTRWVAASGGRGEIIVVSDGSSDDTAARARAAGDSVRVLELAENVGKASALTRGCAEARGEVLVFADTRQRWQDESLVRLLNNFSDESVGGVSGELVLEASPGSLAGVGLYWRYEKWIRRNEGIVHSTIGVSGSIAAVRRALFHAIPQGMVLDDLYWPMQVVLAGRRIVHDSGAVALDALPPRPQDELRRKIRTLSGNFQLMAAVPAILIPLRNPVWLQFVSHKLLRLVVPWLLLALLIDSLYLGGPLYGTVFGLQAAAYAIAASSLLGLLRIRWAPLSALASFLLLNVAAWLAFWVWATGGTGRSWHKTQYAASGME
jgi:poly-beta-1,6-N-acetyl-D-glucosamine synthase